MSVELGNTVITFYPRDVEKIIEDYVYKEFGLLDISASFTAENVSVNVFNTTELMNELLNEGEK